MKRLLLTAVVATTFATQPFAQLAADGTVMGSNVVFTDINGTSHDFYSYTSAGKHIVLDFFQTTCTTCFAHHNAGYFDDYNTAHGLGGEQDAVVIAYEVNDQSTLADLQGTGPLTLGDWLTGTNYYVANSTDNTEMFFTITTFIPTGSFGTPTLVLICNDRSFYKITTTMNEAAIRGLVTATCAAAATPTIGLDEVISDLAPNPSTDYFTFHINQSEGVEMGVVNALGQKIDAEMLSVYDELGKTYQVNTEKWENGIYLVTLKSDKQTVSKRLVVQH